MYNVNSPYAQDFINHNEIIETLKWANENKSNKELIYQLINKAKNLKGLNHKEAALLLECDIPELNEQMKSVAKEIKQKIYGNLI